MKRNLICFLMGVVCFFTLNVEVNAASLKEGIYTIKSALANDKVIDVDNGGTKNKTNVQLYSSNGTNAQKWYVKPIDNGYYEITTVLNNNLALDVDNAGKKNKTNVQVYAKNGTDAQKWIIKDAGGGYYYIISKCNGLYVDVYDAKTANKTNIQMWNGNGTKAQKFKFIEEITGSQTLEDGLYKISSFVNSNMVLSIKGVANQNSKIILENNSDSSKQLWRVKYLNNGYYSIISYANEGMDFDVQGGSPNSSTDIQLYSSNGTDAQKWIIKEEDGYFNIISALDHMYMDIKNGDIETGTGIQIYQNNGTDAQKFMFTKVDEPKIENGYYTINSALDNSKAIDTNSMVGINGIKATLNDNNNLISQKWYIEYLENGYYSIKSGVDQNYVLDVFNGNTTNKTKVQIYSSNNSDAQKWYIKSAGDGYYYIIAKKSNKYLDIDNGNTSNGTSVQIYSGNETKAQKFKLTPATVSENDMQTHKYEEGYYTINSKLDNNKVIDVDNAKKANGTNVQLYSLNNSVAQIWYLKKLDNGYYAILSAMNPEVALTASSDDRTNGINVVISKYEELDTQKWAIRNVGNGYDVIVSKANGLNLDIYNGNTSNGTNIWLYKQNLSNAQLFKIQKFDGQKIYTGIDVSHHQNTIDWGAVAKSDIGFVIIRAGYGGNWTEQDDREFLNNVKACEKYNIPYGLYLYSYASEIDNSDTSAQNEARHMLRLLGQIKEYDYSPNLGTKVFIDMEDDSVVDAGKEQLTSVSDTFCSQIEANGYSCGIYANKTWLTNHLDAEELSKKYDIWLAEWLPVSSPSFSYAKNQKPTYNLTPYKYWQFASDGKLNGIAGNVDFDLGYDIFD